MWRKGAQTNNQAKSPEGEWEEGVQTKRKHTPKPLKQGCEQGEKPTYPQWVAKPKWEGVVEVRSNRQWKRKQERASGALPSLWNKECTKGNTLTRRFAKPEWKSKNKVEVMTGLQTKKEGHVVYTCPQTRFSDFWRDEDANRNIVQTKDCKPPKPPPPHLFMFLIPMSRDWIMII